jgi:hypothetical protein
MLPAHQPCQRLAPLHSTPLHLPPLPSTPLPSSPLPSAPLSAAVALAVAVAVAAVRGVGLHREVDLTRAVRRTGPDRTGQWARKSSMIEGCASPIRDHIMCRGRLWLSLYHWLWLSLYHWLWLSLSQVVCHCLWLWLWLRLWLCGCATDR